MKTMASREASRLFRRISTANAIPIPACRFERGAVPRQCWRRGFHESRSLKVVKPYLLADIGEGITECQVIQWFVKPGARVEQFDPICEVQSDKASVEITSRFDGVIKKLYYEPDDMAKVGKPLVDIDIQSEISAADEVLLNDQATQTQPKEDGLEVGRNDTKAVTEGEPASIPSQDLPPEPAPEQQKSQRHVGKHASLATPAVRHLVKEHNLKIEDIEGTGKEGRVTKDDVQRHANASKQPQPSPTTTPTQASPPLPTPQLSDQIRPLTPIQSSMYKQMTRSLSIPHFLYTDTLSFNSLTTLRQTHNLGKPKSERLSPLPFLLKALSLSLHQYPLLNAHLDTTTNPSKPHLVLKAEHNFGIAVDSPSGLLVPVIRNVQSHSILSLAAEIQRLGALAREGKLSSADFTGATFTLSNIGSIGGGAVAPVIVTPQVGIVGIGRARVVPAFGEHGELVKREECVLSWSADHRVIDGAYVARCAEGVRGLVEGVEGMLVQLR
ncbi:hypothetical protein P154DRAFT_525671 [Amniculicola lignicola CBS 123094]|uniref:Dihydrolipoamide acetyltransferase component of pyruvate dehydrogenase complex n=1 Tax=Amniculicola lignicola CBS 123094 TaxID=1392246 RepID=A0A6A5W4P5_9PLEO|nr:hypothetical protein P154DRAFT_525671 [Amniculicola lignicola CBS 123094]